MLPGITPEYIEYNSTELAAFKKARDFRKPVHYFRSFNKQQKFS